MPYIGEILAVQQFIRDMTGHDVRREVVQMALERAEQFRTEENRRRDRAD